MAEERKSKEPLEYQFYISLMGITPLIWRRFRVPSNITFKKLHDVIQTVMGWQDYHLFEFKYGPIRISIPDDEYFTLDEKHWDARRRKLSTIHPEPNDVLTYTYDFGDHWVHLLHLEWILYPQEGVQAVACLDGERACPPEDVGGKTSYAEFLEVIRNPDDEQHTYFREWSGGDFNPEQFSVESVNEQLLKSYTNVK